MKSSLCHIAVLTLVVVLGGCGSRRHEVTLVGRTRYPVLLPDKVKKNLAADQNDYTCFTANMFGPECWILEPHSEKDPLTVCHSNGVPVLSLQDAHTYQSCARIEKNGRQLVVISVLAYRNEPLLVFVGRNKDNSHQALGTIGGEEWRTRHALDLTISDSKLTVTGIDPDRYAPDKQIADYLTEMGLDLSFAK